MAIFEVKVGKVTAVDPHPNADRLELLTIDGGQTAVVQLGYQKGDYVVVFPEAAVLPADLLRRMGLWKEDKGVGALAGSAGNRVRPAKLRGVLSEVLVAKADALVPDFLSLDDIRVGNDVAELLEIDKYVVHVPPAMQGIMIAAAGQTVRHYDIDAYAKRQAEDAIFKPGESVWVSEKLHGTWCCMGWTKEFGDLVTSKGRSTDEMVFDLTKEENSTKNLYCREFVRFKPVLESIRAVESGIKSIHVMGEIHGPGVQDLHYGLEEKAFRVFDLKLNGRWCDLATMRELQAKLPSESTFELVPIVHEGPFEEDLMARLMRDNEKLRMHQDCFEGFVIRATEKPNKRLKLVSADYFESRGRRGATEYQ